MTTPGAVDRLRALAERSERLGHEAAVERIAGGLDLAVAVRRARFGLREHPRVRLGEDRPTEQRPRIGYREPRLRRGRPFSPEELLERRDAFCDAGEHRVAVARVADRRLHDVAERGRSQLEEHAHPRVERTGHTGGEQARAGDEVELELPKALGRRRCGAGP